jgi:hypothetical protein
MLNLQPDAKHPALDYGRAMTMLNLSGMYPQLKRTSLNQVGEEVFQ